MATLDELQLTIGTEEAVKKLPPATVTINTVTIEEVGLKKAKKVVLGCIHPEAEDTIRISSVKVEQNGKLEVVGLWLNKDAKGLIQKNSALAKLMQFLQASALSELRNKTCVSVEGDKGYLCLKAY